ncbi:hypothetical protein NIES2119_05010 [[Phormidium ambiguum] IAM M-71]|uniref:Uncharacterized protein n=1 Tax=[Phormidium ambiguum] IAM M-71 TaxID=454136 RepID=A0A1U7IQE0_9CYAN|nr:hypothetical protein [Phormidium ambiguum]OKH39634.1 hypothetical protein NIES2119_05010 [Phormidium ambiguum IAM M-71]
MGANISQLYRQSLQPYVDPEILEGVDYLPEIPETTVNTPNIAACQNSQKTRLLILVLTGLCLFGITYNHAVNLAQKLPVSPLMSHTASE